ncbi:dCMP deaminase family protein [bacterium]|nr:dCMP deaminase family protein [bacterium]
MKPKMIKAHMKTAEVYAELSTASRMKVGCIIVKDDRIISIGYNGMPSGWDNTCEESILWDGGKQLIQPLLKTKAEVLHAEANAIAKVARSPESSEGATMFITCSPCLHCAKLIYQSGISTLYYRDNYRSDEGLKFLSQTDIVVKQL